MTVSPFRPPRLASVPGQGMWHWNAEPRRDFAATADEGRALQADIAVAIGVLAQRMLADVFPGSVEPPPTRAGERANALRANCPPVAPPAAAGQTVPAEALAARH
ncbi:hypothetical protein [Neoroseomonas soli]|uniref:Uncharacterized protein n=1 Tax=Neoroseomonas soli TaxID=1081025 RepID=A0A9X9X4A3_9PROT|nr:hypothetical protein [Neoroseomonas soli]MBR0674232.1 hypothetical protein [Neoroseomonas soli]